MRARSVTVQRYKGLGEMNPSQLKETVFQVPEVDGTRTPFASPNLYRVSVEDAHQANEMVELWMGARVGPRKQRLMRVWDAEQSYDGNGDGAYLDEDDEDEPEENEE
jgi:DNA gyrase subunit B